MSFLGFTFLSPAFLIGALAAAIPLIIHLSRSRRTKKMRFSTTRFFTDQFLRSYRMSRLKELLLLACRMCLFFFLALALAQPLFLPKGGSPFAGGSRAVVLVIDDSASMGYEEDGRPVFEKSKKAALDVLAGLKAGDTAAVVLAGRRDVGPEAVFPQLTDRLDDVRQAVEGLRVAPLGTDLSGALARAETIVRGGNASSKEIYVISDLQDSGWEDAPERTAPGGSDASITFVRNRPRTRDNVAVTAVRYGAHRPTANEPFDIIPQIAFQGTATKAEVRLVVDGVPVATRTVERPDRGSWAAPRFHHTFKKPGWHWGYVEAARDNLPLDNRRYFAFQLVESVSVLAVNGAPSQAVPRADELFFLRAALTVGLGEDAESPFRIDERSPAAFAALTPEKLRKYPLVVLANVETLAPAAVARLEEYVRGGGSLFISLGDKVSAADYNERLAGGPGREGLLPGRLIKVEGDAAARRLDYALAEPDFGHPALAPFADPRAGRLTLVRFSAYWKVDPGDSAVLARVRKDEAEETTAPDPSGARRASVADPLLCEKTFGDGRVLLFTSTIDNDWTNFGTRPTYLPLVHRLFVDLAQPAGQRVPAYATGDEIPVPVAAAGGVVNARRFGDDRDKTAPVYPAPARDDPKRLSLTDTTEPGIYEFYPGEQTQQAELVAVNLPGDESKPEALDETVRQRFPDDVKGDDEESVRAGLAKLLPKHPAKLIFYADDPAKAGEAALASRGGVKVWDILLVIVLLIALFEPWLANWISLRHYGKAKPVSAGTPGQAAQGAVRLNARETPPAEEVAAS
jgi:hypothetical protein